MSQNQRIRKRMAQIVLLRLQFGMLLTQFSVIAVVSRKTLGINSRNFSTRKAESATDTPASA